MPKKNKNKRKKPDLKGPKSLSPKKDVKPSEPLGKADFEDEDWGATWTDSAPAKPTVVYDTGAYGDDYGDWWGQTLNDAKKEKTEEKIDPVTGKPVLKTVTYFERPDKLYWIDEGKVWGANNPKIHRLKKLAEEDNLRTVISLLERETINAYDYRDLEKIGVDYISFPIDDYFVPTPEGAKQLVDKIKTALGKGKVLIHCFGGNGRTGMAGALWLIMNNGVDPAEAVKKIRAANPTAIEGSEQMKFILSGGTEKIEKPKYEPVKYDYKYTYDPTKQTQTTGWGGTNPRWQPSKTDLGGPKKSYKELLEVFKEFTAGIAYTKTAFQNAVEDAFLEELETSDIEATVDKDIATLFCTVQIAPNDDDIRDFKEEGIAENDIVKQVEAELVIEVSRSYPMSILVTLSAWGFTAKSGASTPTYEKIEDLEYECDSIEVLDATVDMMIEEARTLVFT